MTATLVLLGWVALLTAPRWIPPVVEHLLASGWQLDELALVGGGVQLPAIARISLSTNGCRLVALEDGRIGLRWDGPVPRLDAVEIAALWVDPMCLPTVPAVAGPTVNPPDRLGGVRGDMRLVVERLTVADWLPDPHRVVVTAATDSLHFSVEGPILKLDAHWNPTAGQGELEARVLQAGPIADLTLGGTLRSGSDLTDGIDLAARFKGALPATRSHLNGEVAARWQGDGVRVDRLHLGFDQLTTLTFTALLPAFELEEPIRLSGAILKLATAVRLRAERLNLPVAGWLDELTIKLRLNGGPTSLLWTAEGKASSGIGPVAGEGQWSKTGLVGNLRLDRQSLPALQGLLPPTLPVELKGGLATVEVAFNWPSGGTDLTLEGELRIGDARLVGMHWAAEGVMIRLPFRYAGATWELGVRRTAVITAETITAAVQADSLSASIAGAWPWSSRAPLQVKDLRLRLLGGEAVLDTLLLPQQGGAATLRLRGIQLDQVSALYGDQVVSLDGAVDAVLPLHLDHDSLLIEEGAVHSATEVRLRLTDSEAIATFKANNPSLAEAADWLSDLHIDHLEGRINLTRDGALVLEATMEGGNPQRGDRPVRLNYRHEENLLALLQSLRIGSDLSRGLEQRLSPPDRGGADVEPVTTAPGGAARCELPAAHRDCTTH